MKKADDIELATKEVTEILRQYKKKVFRLKGKIYDLGLQLRLDVTGACKKNNVSVKKVMMIYGQTLTSLIYTNKEREKDED